MKNQEFDDILASLRQIVQQAYTLGRSDALKQVVDVLKADAVAAKPLALMGPADEAEPAVAAIPSESMEPRLDHTVSAPFKPSNDDHGATAPSEEPVPWYARQPRGVW